MIYRYRLFNVFFFYLWMTAHLYPDEIDQPLKKFILVSCSEKSGSTALANSFQSIDIETLRCHVLDTATIRLIRQRAKNSHVLIIDSIRDVLARKISWFFHDLEIHLNETQEQILNAYEKNKRAFVMYLISVFDQKMHLIRKNFGFQHWKNLGYNCLDEEKFDFENKFQLKNIGNIYFLNLRFDDIKEWEDIIRKIDVPMPLHNFKLLPRNRAVDKWYSDIYKKFLDLFNISQENFDIIFAENMEEIVHFYTEEEIIQFIQRWKPHIRNSSHQLSVRG